MKRWVVLTKNKKDQLYEGWQPMEHYLTESEAIIGMSWHAGHPNVLQTVMLRTSWDEAITVVESEKLDLLHEMHKIHNRMCTAQRDMAQMINEMESDMSIVEHTLHLKEE